MFSSFEALFGLSHVDATSANTLVIFAKQARHKRQGCNSWVTAEHQHRWLLMGRALQSWKSTARKSTLADNNELWKMLEIQCNSVETVLDRLQKEEQALAGTCAFA